MEELNDITKEDKKIFITLSADYGNIGDVAITIAQKRFLANIFPDRKIIEIPLMDFHNHKDIMKKIINNDDIITIIGGGNMGSIYPIIEERRRTIISDYPNNRIISFPQSIDFEDNDNGKIEFEKSIETYGNHKNLTIFSRENKSYQIMSNNYKNEVVLVPDIVMYLMDHIKDNENIKRDKAILCLRNDKEKITSHDMHCILTDLLKNNDYKDIEFTDTHIGDVKINPNEKEKFFNIILEKFQSARVVITDRLHGMIFALISKTPCIAFDNSNKKVSSTYNTWLKDVPYIKTLESFDERQLISYLNEFEKLDMNSININFNSKFEPLIQAIKNEK